MKFKPFVFLAFSFLFSCQAEQDNPLVKFPSCNDGIKNQDEIDIDCGGKCSACIEPAPCKSSLKDNVITFNGKTTTFTANQVHGQTDNYSYKILVHDNTTDDDVTIILPDDYAIPSKSQKYTITASNTPSYDNAFISFDDYYTTTSISGVLYLTVRPTTLIIEFCDVSMHDYFNGDYKISGRVICNK